MIRVVRLALPYARGAPGVCWSPEKAGRVFRNARGPCLDCASRQGPGSLRSASRVAPRGCTSKSGGARRTATRTRQNRRRRSARAGGGPETRRPPFRGSGSGGRRRPGWGRKLSESRSSSHQGAATANRFHVRIRRNRGPVPGAVRWPLRGPESGIRRVPGSNPWCRGPDPGRRRIGARRTRTIPAAVEKPGAAHNERKPPPHRPWGGGPRCAQVRKSGSRRQAS